MHTHWTELHAAGLKIIESPLLGADLDLIHVMQCGCSPIQISMELHLKQAGSIICYMISLII